MTPHWLTCTGMIDRGFFRVALHIVSTDRSRCPLDHVALTARTGQQINAVMSNSFAFGGSNACLIARRAPR